MWNKNFETDKQIVTGVAVHLISILQCFMPDTVYQKKSIIRKIITEFHQKKQSILKKRCKFMQIQKIKENEKITLLQNRNPFYYFNFDNK